MPRIIVTTDVRPDQAEPTVLLDEDLRSVHLSTAHASAQLVERLAWAILDAEQAAGEKPHKPVPALDQVPAHSAANRARRAQPLAA
jgi:hypothetical protein